MKFFYAKVSAQAEQDRNKCRLVFLLAPFASKSLRGVVVTAHCHTVGHADCYYVSDPAILCS